MNQKIPATIFSRKKCELATVQNDPKFMSKYKENVNLATLQTFGKKLGKWRIWQGSRNAVINQLQVILEKIRQH